MYKLCSFCVIIFQILKNFFFISVLQKYYEFRNNVLFELLKPHLVIYLDVPVPKIIENIKKRGISWEQNSSVLTPEYLQVMEKMYKQNYLKQIR